jgi:hypothetical protein
VVLDITEDSIEVTACRLSGGAGLGGTDAYALQQWLLCFGKTSQIPHGFFIPQLGFSFYLNWVSHTPTGFLMELYVQQLLKATEIAFST